MFTDTWGTPRGRVGALGFEGGLKKGVVSGGGVQLPRVLANIFSLIFKGVWFGFKAGALFFSNSFPFLGAR